MSSAEPTRFPRPRPAHDEGLLSRWIESYSLQHQIAADRIRRTLAFEFVLAAFERQSDNGDPLVVIKGGAAMEMRLRLRARATKDVDAMVRGTASPDEIEDLVRAALVDPLLDGAVGFEVRSAQPIGDTGSVRFDVRVQWKRRGFARVRLEVSAAEGGSGATWDLVPSLSLCEQFAMGTGASDVVPCLPLRYQIAQKIHALTDPYEDNDRFRDLIDLLLLDDLENPEGDGALRHACVEVFGLRESHPWPPRVVVREGWNAGFRALAGQMGFPLDDVAQAAADVQAMVDRIDLAGT